MQFTASTLIALSALSSTILAAPTVVATRDLSVIDPTAISDAQIENPKNYAWNADACAHDIGSPARQWVVAVGGDHALDKSCGGGMLDNFRGRCGTITSWECNYYSENPDTAVMHFYTSVACTEYDISAAIKKAGKGRIVNCNSAKGDNGAGGLPDGGVSIADGKI